MRRGGNQLRISVRLVNAANETATWSDAWSRGTADLLAIQTEIAGEVATAIVGELTPGERTARAARARNPAAYEAYVKGLAARRRQNESSLRDAVSFFEESIRLDSAFAPAWAGLADAWTWSDFYQPASVVYPRARAAAARALVLDSMHAGAFAALAATAMYFDWNPAETERLARRALAISPHLARAHVYLGEALMWYAERRAEALGEFRRALADDPDDETVAFEVLYDLRGLGEPEEALALARRWLAADPQAAFASELLLVTLLDLGRCTADAVPAGAEGFSASPAGRP